jgi:hypothetical protein
MADTIKRYSSRDLKSTTGLDSSGGASPNYRVWMWKGNVSDSVSTVMPENWSTSLDIGWQPQFANLLKEALAAAVGGAKAEFATNAANAMGFQIQNKALSSNIWQGTSYLTISIPFIFKVESDVNTELLEPIQRLMRWALPTTTDIMGMDVALAAPYRPFTKLSADTSKKQTSTSSTLVEGNAGSPVTVQFGNFFTLPSCIITSINQTYDSMFDKDGKPVSAKLDVQVMSTTLITAEDIDSMFLRSSK